MPFFKDQSGKIHVLDDAEFSYLLPVGSVQINDLQAFAIIEASKPVKTPLDEIIELEAEKPFTHRALRELSLSVAQIAGMLTGQDPLTQPQIAAIAKLDADIAALRDQAKLQGLI